ncbi:MAG: phosphoribosyltransferase family protein [Candidatus Bathyarchaeota archaeon]|nr:phosphoribosyltransferase family protein [Candidatus Bathyarchaeota archaeon]
MAEIVEEPGLRGRVHVFDDRFHAGELLAEKLGRYRERSDALVLAIPAGGVQVGFVVAERLGVPLDIVVTRKLHVPWNREAGFGAVSWDGLVLLNEPLVAALGLTRGDIERCVAEETEVIGRRLKRFRDGRPFPALTGRTAIVVDDGLASGFSMLATLKALRRGGVGELVVAVPTAPESALGLVRPHADVVYCLNVRSGPFFAVADAYQVWYDLGDEEVVELLRRVEPG